MPAVEEATRPISTADAQIAATCRSHAATLATRNTDDFADTGIATVNPWGIPGSPAVADRGGGRRNPAAR